MSFRNQEESGYSLTEILIVMSIMAMLLVTAYFVFYKQIFKAQDGKRKADLHELTNILEDFYNDNDCYPKPTEICYDAADDADNPCHVCGSEENSPEFGYDLPCNPDHPEMKYLYEVEGGDCPQWYRMYTELADSSNSEICPYGSCGYDPEYGYDYGVSSPNKNLNMNTSHLYAYDKWDSCGDCGDEESCQQSYYLEVYGSLYQCCEDHPTANSCYFYAYDADVNDCVSCGNYYECTDQYGDIYGNKSVCCDSHPGATSCP